MYDGEEWIHFLFKFRFAPINPEKELVNYSSQLDFSPLGIQHIAKTNITLVFHQTTKWKDVLGLYPRQKKMSPSPTTRGTLQRGVLFFTENCLVTEWSRENENYRFII